MYHRTGADRSGGHGGVAGLGFSNEKEACHGGESFRGLGR